MIREHIVTDIELTIINDGDGTQCAYDYHERCGCAQELDGLRDFVDMALQYEGQRLRMGCEPATHEELLESARRLYVYYSEHAEEE